jgi:hypothetical protein
MNNRIPTVVVMFMVVTLCGCSDDFTRDDYLVDQAEQACRDMADGVASAVRVCGGDYLATYNAFVSTAADGDCSRIIAVRDEEALYDDCLPALRALTCDQLGSSTAAQDLPDSCKAQLVR